MPGVELHRDSASSRGLSLSSVLGIGSESVGAMAEVLLLPSLILAFFVAELTPSYVTIGLVPAVAISLWTLARVPARLLTASRRRQRPWAFGAALIRAGAVAILAVVTSRIDPSGLTQSGRPLLLTFFLCLIVFTLAAGFGSVPTEALLRSTIRGEEWKVFVRRRSIATVLLGLVAALIVSRLLGTNGFGYPGNYGRLFLAATVCLIASALFLAATREPSLPSGPYFPALLSPRAFVKPLDDYRFRRFLLFRVLLSFTTAIDPFLFLYAVTRLGIPVTAIGGYAVAGVLGWIVAAPIWIVLERRRGPRAVLQSGAILRLIAPAFALVLPQITEIAQFRARFPDNSLTVALFGLSFVAIGAALAAQARGNGVYLDALSPRTLVPAYSGLANGVLAAVAFAPVIGGFLLQRTSFEVLFGSVIAIGLAAVFAGGALINVSTRYRDRTGDPTSPVRSDPALHPSRT